MVEHIRLANPRALKSIRDSSENDMAKVQAIRTLEGMGDTDTPSGQRQTAPGLVVVIQGGIGQDVTIAPPLPPLIEHETPAESDLALRQRRKLTARRLRRSSSMAKRTTALSMAAASLTASM
jgi:hypothetical protein